jgi:hypothetical protein
MEKLLNFVDDPDVNLLDQVVGALYQGNPQLVCFLGGSAWDSYICFLQRDQAQKVLTKVQDHPNIWTRVDTILEFA